MRTHKKSRTEKGNSREFRSRFCSRSALAADMSQALNISSVLTRLDRIIEDTAHIHEALKTILDIPTVAPTDGLMDYQSDVAGQAGSEATAQTVLARETANQQLIHLLEKMYDDLKQNLSALREK